MAQDDMREKHWSEAHFDRTTVDPRGRKADRAHACQASYGGVFSSLWLDVDARRSGTDASSGVTSPLIQTIRIISEAVSAHVAGAEKS